MLGKNFSRRRLDFFSYFFQKEALIFHANCPFLFFFTKEALAFNANCLDNFQEMSKPLLWKKKKKKKKRKYNKCVVCWIFLTVFTLFIIVGQLKWNGSILFQGRQLKCFLPSVWQGDYRTYSTYSDRQALANDVDPDQMLQNVASDQGLHCH